MNKDDPIMTNEQTWAALGKLNLRGFIEFDESGEKYALTDAGFEETFLLMEKLSDEEKVLLFSVRGMMEFIGNEERKDD